MVRAVAVLLAAMVGMVVVGPGQMRGVWGNSLVLEDEAGRAMWGGDAADAKIKLPPQVIMEQWGHLDTLDKLEWLLSETTWYGYEQDFKRVDASEDDLITLAELEAFGIDFSDAELLTRFFSTADTDKSGDVSLTEYVVARGNFDEYGAEHEVSEWDTLETDLLDAYEEHLRTSGQNTEYLSSTARPRWEL